MPILPCVVTGCNFETPDVSDAAAIAYLQIHGYEHAPAPAPAPATPAPATPSAQRLPRFERPKISLGSSEEVWIGFKTRWEMFKRGTTITAADAAYHLFQCCDDPLGNSVLKAKPDAALGTEDTLLATIKQLAVTPVAITVRRSELLNLKQDHGENARAFFTKLRGKSATCSYTMVCSSNACTQVTTQTWY